MAKNTAGPHKLPGGPSKPMMPYEPPRYQKRNSYSPEQSDHDAYCSYYDRSAQTESPSSLSPGPPTKNWGNGSYDSSGRSKSGVGYGGGNAKLSAGPVTRGSPGKPSRPGRW